MPNFIPEATFSFQIRCGTADSPVDARFGGVSGIETAPETSSQPETGPRRLPDAITSQILTLKRGMIVKQSTLYQWCQDALHGMSAVPLPVKDIVISLMDANGSEAASWTAHGAFPVKWQIASFGADTNDLVAETLEIAFQRLTRNTGTR